MIECIFRLIRLLETGTLRGGTIQTVNFVTDWA